MTESNGNGYTTFSELESLEGRRSFLDVPVSDPYNDGHVLRFRIRSLCEEEWSEISSSNLDKKKGGLSETGIKQSDSRLVAASLVDAEGNLLYSGKDAYKRVGRLHTGIVEPLVRACRELNKLRSGDEDEEGN